jgi:hypothetical protein
MYNSENTFDAAKNSLLLSFPLKNFDFFVELIEIRVIAGANVSEIDKHTGLFHRNV